MSDDDKTVLTGDAVDGDATDKKNEDVKTEDSEAEKAAAEKEAAAKVIYDADEKSEEEKAAAEAEAKAVSEKEAAADDKAKEAEDAKSDKADGAPAEGYAEFTVPEGMELNKEVAAEFMPVAKELNLTQDQAQSLVNLQSKQMQELSSAQEKTWADTQDKWREDSKSDKDFGGEKFDENVALAKTALDKLGTSELRDLLDVTGTGNHPEVIRLLVKVGKLIGEDNVNLGNVAGEGPKDPARVLFPGMN